MSISLTLIPPSPITTQVPIDIRLGVRNTNNKDINCTVWIYLDNECDENLLHNEYLRIAAGTSVCSKILWQPADIQGRHNIIAVCHIAEQTLHTEKTIEIIESQFRSTSRIDGAWNSIMHWSPIESQLWREDIRKLTDDQWREQVRAMHEIGMDIIVIQEVFQNQAYAGQHRIAESGYSGKAFYPSKLFDSRVEMTATDVLEAIFSEADKLGMTVFPGVGLYAWFDFTPESLVWHKQVAKELWQMYGHHPSFYGWYISEEVHGEISVDMLHDKCDKVSYRRQIIDFFKQFNAYIQLLTPDKPVMLAPNCHHISKAVNIWSELLQHIDILCPFGFHRMPENDINGLQAAASFQELCDKACSHLWMDMEVFLFNHNGALIPRLIEDIINDINEYTNFEKILCYQFPGLMNAPWASMKPGGPSTVSLFTDYRDMVFKPKSFNLVS